MSKKLKIIFGSSIGLNILLVLIVSSGLTKMHFVKDEVFVTTVQINLVELEGLIAAQKDEDWLAPNLVTTKLVDILEGIQLGITTGEQLGTLTNQEKEAFEQLYTKLNQYPHDELYRFVELTEADQRNFEQLSYTLRDVGLGLNMQISTNMDAFMKQVEALNEEITSPLALLE